MDKDLDYYTEKISPKKGKDNAPKSKTEAPDKNALHTAQKAQEIFTDSTAKGKPYTINSLKVDGNDIKSLGFEGEQLSQCLENLLDHVIDGTLDNEKSVLIKYIKNKK